MSSPRSARATRSARPPGSRPRDATASVLTPGREPLVPRGRGERRAHPLDLGRCPAARVLPFDPRRPFRRLEPSRAVAVEDGHEQVGAVAGDGSPDAGEDDGGRVGREQVDGPSLAAGGIGQPQGGGPAGDVPGRVQDRGAQAVLDVRQRERPPAERSRQRDHRRMAPQVGTQCADQITLPPGRQHAVEAVAVERLRPVPGDEPRVDVERPAGERGRPGLGQDPVREAAQLPPGRRRGVARVDGGGGEVGEGPGERVVQEPGRTEARAASRCSRFGSRSFRVRRTSSATRSCRRAGSPVRTVRSTSRPRARPRRLGSPRTPPPGRAPPPPRRGGGP
ncbi:hypothetical protein LUX57_02765 [Actinomadura madurae]|uniref:hypothetical protein n=1 Tax=Actinomadura madurae TaxID=1993 RepID=UPI0020D245B2|nr:hypothetical protein [Actinomadura madurae]MCP9964242.1 hypothetical protein [Actinomadura madurae]